MAFTDVLNLTPHDVSVFSAGSDVLAVFRRTGAVLRCDSDTSAPRTAFRGLPMVQPPVFTGTSFIFDGNVDRETFQTQLARAKVVVVASLVGEYLKQHPPAAGDPLHGKAIVSPNAGPTDAVRDRAGRICGVRSLVAWTKV